MFSNTYKKKTVIVTGHTGFKGSWLTLWLKLLGAKVIGISLDPPSSPSNFIASNIKDILNEDIRIDIRSYKILFKEINRIKPDFVFHLAAQALVKNSYRNPIDTFEVNSIGSANLLYSLYKIDRPVKVVMITSDKSYHNKEWIWGYRETDEIGGKDPYSASKGMAELAIRSIIDSYHINNLNSKIKVAIGRAGNVIGGGDWALDRIVPDCIKAWSKNKTVDIRNPYSTRPWQHVLEPLSGYLLLGEYLQKSAKINGEAYNFGPSINSDYNVEQLINEMKKHWENVRWKTESRIPSEHEAGLLKLNCEKAFSQLEWLPVMNFEETLELTVNWYKTYYDKPKISMKYKTEEQIHKFMELARIKNYNWTK